MGFGWKPIWNRFEPKLRPAIRKYKRFEKAQVDIRAQALAYHSLLSIVPVLGLVFWYLHSIPLWDRWREEIRRWILAQLNVSSSEVFLRTFEKLTTSVTGDGWGWIGLIVLLYTAWNLIRRFGEGVDMILETSASPPVIQRGWWRLFLRRLLIMLVLPLALGLTLAATQWIREDSVFHYLTDIDRVGPFLALPLAWVVQIVAVFLIYYLVPRYGVPWRQALRAALIVAPVFELARFGFGTYNTYAVSVHKIYGVLAVIPMFFIWVQLCWLILLSGVLFMRFKPPAKKKAN